MLFKIEAFFFQWLISIESWAFNRFIIFLYYWILLNNNRTVKMTSSSWIMNLFCIIFYIYFFFKTTKNCNRWDTCHLHSLSTSFEGDKKKYFVTHVAFFFLCTPQRNFTLYRIIFLIIFYFITTSIHLILLYSLTFHRAHMFNWNIFFSFSTKFATT